MESHNYTCAMCHAEAEWACKHCEKQFYCSRECRVKDNDHKLVCAPVFGGSRLSKHQFAQAMDHFKSSFQLTIKGFLSQWKQGLRKDTTQALIALQQHWKTFVATSPRWTNLLITRLEKALDLIDRDIGELLDYQYKCGLASLRGRQPPCPVGSRDMATALLDAFFVLGTRLIDCTLTGGNVVVGWLRANGRWVKAKKLELRCIGLQTRRLRLSQQVY